MKNLFNIGFVVLILVVLGCNCQKLQELANESKSTPSSSPSNSPSSSSSPSTSDKKAGLTLDKFNQIKNGMTYKEVVDIMGSEGTQTLSSGDGKYKVEAYKWEGDNFQYLQITLLGDKVNSKSQNGLK